MKSYVKPHVVAMLQHGEGVSASTQLIRLSGALALVLLFICGLAWMARRSGWGTQARGNPQLHVRHSLSLGQRERVAIVEAGNRWFLLGITPTSITLLSEIDKSADEQEGPALSAGLFQQVLLSAMRNKENKEKGEQ
ncbi:flagellar biosynthetic protein FliO [Pantoea sp. KPR_PJ]|uniref:flagellar biosynthetic protein FliO n=1 Tax=Pantoea sp. KPR_PJ TaxID=2738375 RepID=UPI0035271203